MKTRRINVTGEAKDYKWQRNSPEIVKLQEEIKNGKSWNFTLKENMIYTKDGKIWIPAEKARDDKEHTYFVSTLYMADNFDMHNIKESVKETIRHREACQRTKIVITKTREETIKLTATKPGEKIYIDICGPLNETFRKKKYIIGIIDHFSRYISLTAISRQG